jgi:hypothetical protein
VPNIVSRCAAFSAAVAVLLLVMGCESRPSSGDFAAYESMLRKDGRLRTETAPGDAAYDAADLVRNFGRIAMRKETDGTRLGGAGNSKSSPLRRWSGPLRYRLYGGGVTQADHAEVSRLMDRIAALTGLEVSESASDPNLRILITVPAERDAVSRELGQVNPQFRGAFEYWRQHSEVVCVFQDEFAGQDGAEVVSAMAAIGSETTGILRTACLHEEVVQALGLTNDDGTVRPSIFNDDAEFALLTDHDQDLVRILYDPRLTPGMTANEAMPIVETIARAMVR